MNLPPASGSQKKTARGALIGLVVLLGIHGRICAEPSEKEEAMDALVAMQEHKEKNTAGSQDEIVTDELREYQKELLAFPKKDRLRFGQDTHYTYDSNPVRSRIHYEKGDSSFRINPFIAVNMSGPKTDLQTEYRWNRVYNVKRPESDDESQEISFRFGRRIFPKTQLSLNDRLSRGSVRSTSIQDRKITWGNSHRAALSYELNPKIALNLEANYTRTDLTHEEFDETSNDSFSLDPNLTLQLTPKSRISLGYRWNFTRIPTESSDATTHELRAGYSGKLTPKSSVSGDFAYAYKVPNSSQASTTHTARTSAGYVWQATPKTSFRFLYSNSFELAVSDGVSGALLTKTSVRTSSDTVSAALRVRLLKKLTTELSFNGSHNHSITKTSGQSNARTRQFTFPFQAAVDYDLHKWVKLRLTYTYRHRIGDEDKTDEHRAHTLFGGMNVAV